MELDHHITHKRGETGCVDDLKYWCEKWGYPMTENEVSSWWDNVHQVNSVNRAMRSTSSGLQNIMNAKFGWPAITEETPF